MPRPITRILDEIEELLRQDQTVHHELATELIMGLPRAEREQWLALLAAMALEAR